MLKSGGEKYFSQQYSITLLTKIKCSMFIIFRIFISYYTLMKLIDSDVSNKNQLALNNSKSK